MTVSDGNAKKTYDGGISDLPAPSQTRAPERSAAPARFPSRPPPPSPHHDWAAWMGWQCVELGSGTPLSSVTSVSVCTVRRSLALGNPRTSPWEYGNPKRKKKLVVLSRSTLRVFILEQSLRFQTCARTQPSRPLATRARGSDVVE